MKTQCLIVDDEPLAIELLETHLALLDQLELVASCTNAIQAMEVIQHQHVDLLFLDIQMPMLTGIEFLKSLKNPPKVIFTTAYRDYALEGYELDVVDYLLKPISFDRFFKAVTKYQQLASTVSSQVLTTESVKPLEKDYFYVKINKKHHKVRFHEVLYIESIKDYIKIHLEDGELLVKEKISEIESQLPDQLFLRIHRSFIVNVEKVSAFTAHDVEIGKMEIPIGISYKQVALKALIADQ
ncbi:MAG: LytR/AlgR family response regulator transcription factor [Flammeovirgaceae bacterium]